MFHNGGQIEDVGLHDGDMYLDLGDDSIETIETELKHLVSEAVRNRLSKEWIKN